MVNYLACDAPETFSAYVPVSGGFWRPHPESCNGPIRMFHTHGWIRQCRSARGAFAGRWPLSIKAISLPGLEIWRDGNMAVLIHKPSGFSYHRCQFMRRTLDGTCAEGSALEFALFPGGHTVPTGLGGYDPGLVRRDCPAVDYSAGVMLPLPSIRRFNSLR